MDNDLNPGYPGVAFWGVILIASLIALGGLAVWYAVRWVLDLAVSVIMWPRWRR